MPNEKPIPQQIPLAQIHDLPDTPIVRQPDKAYGGLVSSILVDGVKEPVIVRQAEDGIYQLVAGYRRRRAAELAKLKELPALVYDMTLKEAQDYRKLANTDPKAPIPGKLVDKAALAAKETAKDKKAEDKKLEENAAAAPKAEKAEKPETAPAGKKGAEEAKPKAQEENAAATPKAPAKKAEAKEEDKPAAKTAYGPTGTTITKLLGEKLDPPTDKDKKALPVPGEGETFSAVLHPAYLKKAEINTFSVDRDSDDFKELYQSIKRFGVKDPVLARFGKDGELEILSGQCRHLIASELNYPVPTIIQQLDDDDARILVADGNLHRERISTYDLSRALRMKADSMKRKAGRRVRGTESGPATDELLAKEMGMSTMKLNRLMKLSEATRQICDFVDDGTIPVSIAYNIAFLSPKHQDMVADLVGINVRVSAENTNNLKKYLKAADGRERVQAILEGKYPPPKVVEMPKAKQETPPGAATPAMAPTSIPKSPDIPAPPARPSEPPTPPAAPAVPGAALVPATEATQDRENSYETKIVLRGDRLRKYFPDVTMTPLAIENSIYDALEERRQRQEKAKQTQAKKDEIFKKGDAR